MPSLYGGTVYESFRCPFCGSDITGMANKPELCPNCNALLSDEIKPILARGLHDPHAYPDPTKPDDPTKPIDDGKPR